LTHYSFRSFDLQGALSQNLVCRDDLDALDEGVRRAGKSAVEVWHGARLVARVKLGKAPLTARDSSSL